MKEKDIKEPYHFSIIAHSLGGLFSRCCLKTLFENEMQKYLIPIVINSFIVN